MESKICLVLFYQKELNYLSFKKEDSHIALQIELLLHSTHQIYKDHMGFRLTFKEVHSKDFRKMLITFNLIRIVLTNQNPQFLNYNLNLLANFMVLNLDELHLFYEDK